MSTLLPNGRVDHWIDGRRIAPHAGRYLPSIDPSLGTAWIEDRKSTRLNSNHRP